MARGPQRHGEIEEWLSAHVESGHWPGGVYAAGPAGSFPLWLGSAGRISRVPEDRPARVDALYDLASLTKPLATATIALRLSARGIVDLDEPLDAWLPEMTGYAGRTPSLADLLTHRSGLPAWSPLYRRAAQPADVPSLIAELPPVAGARERAVYSCLGPILAGIALERRTASDLRRLLADEVCEPLGLGSAELTYGPLPEVLRARTAPTESGRRREAELAGSGYRGEEIVPGSGEPLLGEVNDGNARFLGGAAGNAGLFGTAAAAFRLGAALAGPSTFLGAREWNRLVTIGGVDDDDARTFGFQSGAARGAPAGPLGTGSYGHVGFTGTSLWIRPEPPLVAVLLTNRIHPRWVEAPMQTWRAEFHRIVADGHEESAS